MSSMPGDESAPQATPCPYTRPARLVLLLLLALAVWQAIPTLRKLPAAIAFPFALDREEGFLVVQAQRLRAGESMYPQVGNGLYLVGNYPPLYPAAMAAAAGTGSPSLAHGRAIVAASLLAIVLGLGFAVHAGTRSPEAAGIAALLPLGSYEFAYWSPFARVDLPAAALALWGLILVSRAASPRIWYAAGACLLLAAFTKQTQVLATVVALAVLWRIHGRGCALAFGGKLALAFAATGVALLLATRGQAWLHLVAYNANEMHWDQLRFWVRHVALFNGPLILAVPAAWYFLRRAGSEEPLRAMSTGWLIVSCIEALSLAKAGAAANYLIDFQIALALWIGLRLADAEGIRSRVLAAALALHFVLPLPPHRREILANVSTPTAAQAEGTALLESRIVAAEGPVLCEDPVPLTRLGMPVTYQPFIAAQLAREGAADLSPLDARIRGREFALVVTLQDVDTDPVLFGFADSTRDALRACYRPAGRVAAGPVTYHLREPRDP